MTTTEKIREQFPHRDFHKFPIQPEELDRAEDRAEGKKPAWFEVEDEEPPQSSPNG